MSRRSLLTLFALGAVAALVVMVQRSEVVVEPPGSLGLLSRLTPSPYPTPLSDLYRGDVGGFERRARALDGLRLENRQAYLALANAQIFTTAGIGAAGQLSRHVAAFQSLLADPGADGAFKELVAIAGPPGQLYGLSGTYFTDPAFFREAIGRFRGSSAPVIFLNGCNYGHETVGQVVKLIEAGDLPKSFRNGERAAKSNARV